MRHLRRWHALLILPALLVALSAARPAQAPGARLTILLPLGRTAYQTNEWIDVSVAREANGALPQSDLVLTLSGADGSRISSTFAAAATTEHRRTEHLHVNGWL